MGVTKTEQFSSSQNLMANLFKALAHPARVAIVEHLLSVKACICGDLVNELPLAQATISQHLKELKNAGIIKGTVEGTSVCYCLNPQIIAQMQHWLNQVLFSAVGESSQDCCN